jgi:hypothetical protein
MFPTVHRGLSLKENSGKIISCISETFPTSSNTRHQEQKTPDKENYRHNIRSQIALGWKDAEGTLKRAKI